MSLWQNSKPADEGGADDPGGAMDATTGRHLDAPACRSSPPSRSAVAVCPARNTRTDVAGIVRREPPNGPDMGWTASGPLEAPRLRSRTVG